MRCGDPIPFLHVLDGVVLQIRPWNPEGNVTGVNMHIPSSPCRTTDFRSTGQPRFTAAVNLRTVLSEVRDSGCTFAWEKHRDVSPSRADCQLRYACLYRNCPVCTYVRPLIPEPLFPFVRRVILFAWWALRGGLMPRLEYLYCSVRTAEPSIMCNKTPHINIAARMPLPRLRDLFWKFAFPCPSWVGSCAVTSGSSGRVIIFARWVLLHVAIF